MDRGQEPGHVHPARPVDPAPTSTRPTWPITAQRRHGRRPARASSGPGPGRRRGAGVPELDHDARPGDVVLTGAPGEPPADPARRHAGSPSPGSATLANPVVRQNRTAAGLSAPSERSHDDQRPPAPDVLTFGEAMAMFVAEHPRLARRGRALHAGRWPGAETNVATGLARLGHSTGWIGRVGDDPFGRFIHTALSATGIDTGARHHRPGGAHRLPAQAPRRRRRPGGRLLPEELRRLPAAPGIRRWRATSAPPGTCTSPASRWPCRPAPGTSRSGRCRWPGATA